MSTTTYHPSAHHAQPRPTRREEARANRFLYPTGELARRTAEYARARQAREAIPKRHIPKWRLKACIAVGLFPILWILPKCADPGCGKPWPCGPILKHLRRVHGWACDITLPLKNMSTAGRRAKAAARASTTSRRHQRD